MNMAKRLTLEELVQHRDLIFQLARVLDRRRVELFFADKIDREEFKKLGLEQRRLLDIVDDYILDILKEIKTDIEQPGNQIKSATASVESAINELEKSNEILGIVGEAINLFASIIGAVSNPNPFAAISNILDRIRHLVEG
jgi:uncharacterized membrane protein